MSDPTPLARLADRTRELVLDLETQRADVLSVADLNRALRQVLRNQVAILDALAGGAQAAAPSIRVTATAKAAAAPASGNGAEGKNGAAKHDAGVGVWSATDAREREADVAAAPAEAACAAAPAPAVDDAPAPAAPTDKDPAIEQLLQESRVLPTHLARGIVEEFDNRDKSYEKGLEKLNRWVSGGAGTPFQWRGDRAYLNLNGAGPAAVKNYEEQLMSRMGFSRRLGRLVVPGLQGEVIIYERPS